MNRTVTQKHIFLSDFQIPDHDEKSLEAVYKFILDFKPDKIHLVGDLLNFTSVGKYLKDPYYDVNIQDEVAIGKKVIGRLNKIARKANPKCKISWYSGNHEYRVESYLGRVAPELAKLEGDEGYLVSVPNLFRLKELDIKWVPYWKTHVESDFIVEHGDRVRAHSAYTGKAMLDSRQKSGFSGHTHRLGLHMQTHMGESKFWVELGCLCKLDFESPYAKNPNWQQGFAYAITVGKKCYPTVVSITDHSFYANGKLYSG